VGQNLDGEDAAETLGEDDLHPIAEAVARDDDRHSREGAGRIRCLDLADQRGEALLEDREVVVSFDLRHAG
jgi:hypothetical protein